MMANASVLESAISVCSEINHTDINKKDEIQSEQALVEAAAVGNLEKVYELLETGVSVDADEYNKLLFYASKKYVTPLQIAAANGHEKCVQILIHHGADVNAKDRFDVTALHMAAEKGHYVCLKALLNAGSDCCVATKSTKSACFATAPYVGGTTPLHLAALKNHVDCVIELIRYGADYNAVDECGRTSLYIATRGGYDACVLAHLKNAVGKDILSLPSFETSDTPLHFAVVRGMVDCVKELLFLGSDINHVNSHGLSPLHLALAPSNLKAPIKLEILKLLILEGYNANINYPDSRGFRPLHYVSFNGYHSLWCRRPELAKFLIAYGADVNIINLQGYSLLECELKSPERNSEILSYLVESMLHLPRLKTLRIDSHLDHFGNDNHELENALFDRDFDLDEPVYVPPGRNYAPGVNFQNINAPVLSPNHMRPHRPLGIRRRVRHARFPEFNINDDGLVEHIDERNVVENENDAKENLPLESSDMIQKQLWYEQISSNPRTLQHNCRYVIRKCLGVSKLKLIKSLPIPTSIRSYLLLGYDE